MRKEIQTVVLTALLIAPASVAHAQVTFGIRFGAPPAPRAYRVPAQPGPDFLWIEGYWYPQGTRYQWHNGYWTRPPYEGAYWVAPYHADGRYVPGSWEGSRNNFSHSHAWDRSKQRDERRNPPARGRGGDRDDNRSNRRD